MCLSNPQNVETCIFLLGLFLIWSVRSVENQEENKGQKEKNRDTRKTPTKRRINLFFLFVGDPWFLTLFQIIKDNMEATKKILKMIF